MLAPSLHRYWNAYCSGERGAAESCSSRPCQTLTMVSGMLPTQTVVTPSPPATAVGLTSPSPPAAARGDAAAAAGACNAKGFSAVGLGIALQGGQEWTRP